MNKHFYFKKQLDEGAREMFFYGLEYPADAAGDIKIEIKSHKSSLDEFSDLEYIRHLSEGIPLFKKCSEVE